MSWTPVFLPPDVITVTQRVDAEAVGLGRILLVRPPEGYRHILDARIEWGDLWFRPCDGTWVEVGAAMVGSFGQNPSAVCARRELVNHFSGLNKFHVSSLRLRFLKNKFDSTPATCDTPRVTTTKLYNIGAYGIPANVLATIRTWNLELNWSAHARTEAAALVRNLGFKAEAFGKRFVAVNYWEVVEAEVDASGAPIKIVARRPIADSKWSLVLVIKSDGTVKTCWANLTTDKHRTLNLANYNKA